MDRVNDERPPEHRYRVIIGSMARSGSTWTFNACRLLAEHVYGAKHVNASDFNSYVECPEAKIEILKAHEPIACKGVQVITTIRDLRDAFCSGVAAGLLEIASYPRRGLVDGVYDGIDLLFVEPSRYWKQHADLVVRFEDMMLNKVGTLAQLGRQLFPDTNFTQTWLEQKAMELELLPLIYSDYDPAQSYLFGRPHVQGIGVAGFIKHMPWHDSEDLAYRYKDWFEEFGYTADVASLAGDLVL